MKNSNLILNPEAMEFLASYLNHSSPTGFEWENQERWMSYLLPYVDGFTTDTYGNTVGIINPEAKYKVVLEAHADEISWYVNYITEDGMIFVVPNGGSD